MKPRFRIKNNTTCTFVNREGEIMFCYWALNRELTEGDRRVILRQIGFKPNKIWQNPIVSMDRTAL